MKQFLDRLNQAKAKNVGSHSAILDAAQQWKGMGHNLLESVQNIVADIEKREQNLVSVTEWLDKRLKDVEEREREFEGKKSELALKEGALGPLLNDLAKEVDLKEEKLDEQLKLVNEHIESLEVSQREAQELKLLQSKKLKEIEMKEREVDLMRGSLERSLREAEQREEEFNLFQDKKLRELVVKEELLSKKREEFVKEVKLADEKFREGEKMGCRLIKRLELAMSTLEGMKATIDERFEEIESQEAAGRKGLTEIADEAELTCEQVEKRFEELEKMLEGLRSSQEDQMQKVELKDKQASVIREEILKQIKLVDEKFSVQQELGHQLSECLEEITSKKLSEMGSLQLSAQDSNLNGEFVDVRLQELKAMEEKFHLYQEKKRREIELEEKKLRLTMEEFIRVVKYNDKKFVEQEKLLNGLLRRLELAQSKVADMNKLVRGWFKEISPKDDAFGYIERKAKCQEFQAGKIWEGKNEIKAKEDDKVSEENTREGKRKVLELEGGSLGSQKKELAWKEQHPEVCDLPDKNLNLTRDYSLNNLHQLGRNYLDGKPIICHMKEREMQRQQLTDAFDAHIRKECELKRQQLTYALDAHSRTERVGSVNLKRGVDFTILEMVIINTQNDLESMADEVLEVLLRSPDPAKLVLDAFCTPQSLEGHPELNMRRIRILLLEQLTKMSPNIQPYVQEVATKLANSWKLNMRTVDENPLQVLEFLHLLAAYNLKSRFDKDELLTLLKAVAQHKQTPELCCYLDLTDKVHDLVQDLINEKQYLLASTYIRVCKLEKVFPQAAVFNYYVKHVEMLARAKCKKEHNSSEAQVRATFDEIADLRIAIEHIVKLGLESEFSPDILMERIMHLESDLISLKNGIVSSLSTCRCRQGKGKSAFQLQDASTRNARHNEDKPAKEAAPVANPPLPREGSDAGIPFGWKALDQKRETKKRRASICLQEPPSRERMETTPFDLTRVVDNGLVGHSYGSWKRRRKSPRDLWHRRRHHRFRR